MAVALAPRLWPDRCYGRPHFRVHGDLTNSQGFSYHLFQIWVSSSNLFPATNTGYEFAYGPLDRHFKYNRTIMNSASSLALTFPLLQSLKPPTFLTQMPKNCWLATALFPSLFIAGHHVLRILARLCLSHSTPFQAFILSHLRYCRVRVPLVSVAPDCAAFPLRPLLTWFLLLWTPFPTYIYLSSPISSETQFKSQR